MLFQSTLLTSEPKSNEVGSTVEEKGVSPDSNELYVEHTNISDFEFTK